MRLRVVTRRLQLLRALGSRLPPFRGRGAVFNVASRLLALSLESTRIVDGELGALALDPKWPGPMRDTFYGVVSEKPTLSLIRRYLREGDLAIDVGANFGGMARYFAQLVGASGHVDAFEPEPRLFRFLATNAELAPAGNVTAHELALGSSAEKRMLYLFEGRRAPGGYRTNDGMNTLTGRSGSRTTSLVRVETLDGLYSEATPALVKIDVEGWEAHVIEGGRELLARMVRGRGLVVVEAFLAEHDEHADELRERINELCAAGMHAFVADERSLRSWAGEVVTGNLLLASELALASLVGGPSHAFATHAPATRI